MLSGAGELAYRTTPQCHPLVDLAQIVSDNFQGRAVRLETGGNLSSLSHQGKGGLENALPFYAPVKKQTNQSTPRSPPAHADCQQWSTDQMEPLSFILQLKSCSETYHSFDRRQIASSCSLQEATSHPRIACNTLSASCQPEGLSKSNSTHLILRMSL